MQIYLYTIMLEHTIDCATCFDKYCYLQTQHNTHSFTLFSVYTGRIPRMWKMS